MSEDEILLTHILNCKPIDLIIKKSVLTVQQQRTFEDYKRRRKNGEPLQYILGSWNFMGLELKITPAVLVPRPETEQLVELALNKIKSIDHPHILDIGTGSGNIPIALAKFHPGAHIVSVDSSLDALSLAQENAQIHNAEKSIHFIQEDIKTGVRPRFLDKNRGLTPVFDLVISNPPYIATGEIAALPLDVQQEPLLALDGGADGLDFYRAIIKLTPSLLRQGGYLMMEIGDGQWNDISSLLKLKEAFNSWDVACDLTDRQRFVIAQK